MSDVTTNSGVSLPTPTLRTVRLRLRPFTEADTDTISTVCAVPVTLFATYCSPIRSKGGDEMNAG